MTGHGRGTAGEGASAVVVEITSVNKRSLDIFVKAPRGLEALEPLLEGRVRGALNRGSIKVSCELQSASAASRFEWDTAAVADALRRLSDLARASGVPFEPDARVLLELAREHRSGNGAIDLEKVAPLFERAADGALAELGAMRAREGASLAASLSSQLANLRSWVAGMREGLSGVVAHHREQLLKRLREAGLQLDVSDERVLKEVALFADRSDVSEELTRLDSHFTQFESLLNAREPVGRKLEFLLQEIHREINTLGSKSPSVQVTRLVMECKNELERMKEQSANVE